MRENSKFQKSTKFEIEIQKKKIGMSKKLFENFLKVVRNGLPDSGTKFGVIRMGGKKALFTPPPRA